MDMMNESKLRKREEEDVLGNIQEWMMFLSNKKYLKNNEVMSQTPQMVVACMRKSN